MNGMSRENSPPLTGHPDESVSWQPAHFRRARLLSGRDIPSMFHHDASALVSETEERRGLYADHSSN